MGCSWSCLPDVEPVGRDAADKFGFDSSLDEEDGELTLEAVELILRKLNREHRVRLGPDDFTISYKTARVAPGSPLPSPFCLVPIPDYPNHARLGLRWGSPMRLERETPQQASGRGDRAKDVTTEARAADPTAVKGTVTKQLITRSTLPSKATPPVTSTLGTEERAILERKYESQAGLVETNGVSRKDETPPICSQPQQNGIRNARSGKAYSSLRADTMSCSEKTEQLAKSRGHEMMRSSEHKHKEFTTENTCVISQQSNGEVTCKATEIKDISMGHKTCSTAESNGVSEGVSEKPTQKVDEMSKLKSTGTSKLTESARQCHMSRQRVVKATSAGGRRRYDQRKRKK